MFHNLARLLRYRGLIQSLVARELKARYRGSVLGFFWSFINPLLLLLVYSFVFTYVLPRALQGHRALRAVHVLRHPALDLVLLVAERVGRGAHLRRQSDQEGAVPRRDPADRHGAGEHGALLLRPGDPGGFLVYYQRPLNVGELALFPVVVLVQLILTLGFALILSALTVHFRDIRDILSNLMTFWFFATPIIYPYFQDPKPVADAHF